MADEATARIQYVYRLVQVLLIYMLVRSAFFWTSSEDSEFENWLDENELTKFEKQFNEAGNFEDLLIFCRCCLPVKL